MSRSTSAPTSEAKAGGGRAPAGSRPVRQRPAWLTNRPSFLVGAAIGTGIAAKSAIRGGADFLIALSAGRMRNMGEPSIAAMLPMHASNDFVLGFATTEILPRASVPVFFGASCFDPREDLDALLDRIGEAGFSGVANFPSAVLIDGAFRGFLEASGIGFARELDLLERAGRRSMATLAYTHTAEEAAAAARRGVDIVNIDLGWNTGGVLGVETSLRVEEAAFTAATVAKAVRSASPGTLCVVEGGPIVSPRQLEDLCMVAEVDGYVGGSTIDRVPSESAIEAVTATFKAIGALQQGQASARRLDRRTFPHSLWGHSPAVENARTLFARLASTEHPVLIAGEPGSGRREIARALHTLSARRGRDVVTVDCAGAPAERLALDLFGCMAGAAPGVTRTRIGWLEIARGSTLVLDRVEKLPLETQRMLVAAVDSGRYWRRGGEEALALDVRVIAIADRPLRDPGNADLDPRFAEWIGCFTIPVPPLRQRAQDLPSLIEEALASAAERGGGERKALEPSVFRLLCDYDWPGNVRQLNAVLERAHVACPGAVIGVEHLPELEASRRPDTALTGVSEKAWILDALKHNRFRRGRTADYLGISRKTLYNKMKALGLLRS
ncbi:phosphoenolpyruvate hydrolase family protein [Alsobacter sp. R-9]